jgi:hypothetical protein
VGAAVAGAVACVVATGVLVVSDETAAIAAVEVEIPMRRTPAAASEVRRILSIRRWRFFKTIFPRKSIKVMEKYVKYIDYIPDSTRLTNRGCLSACRISRTRFGQRAVLRYLGGRARGFAQCNPLINMVDKVFAEPLRNIF